MGKWWQEDFLIVPICVATPSILVKIYSSPWLLTMQPPDLMISVTQIKEIPHKWKDKYMNQRSDNKSGGVSGRKIRDKDELYLINWESYINPLINTTSTLTKTTALSVINQVTGVMVTSKSWPSMVDIIGAIAGGINTKTTFIPDLTIYSMVN